MIVGHHMDIPLVDLAAQYKDIARDVDGKIRKVCKKADFILGSEVAEFETVFSGYIGTKYTIGVASGTDAIKLMAIASGIGPGDEVIVQANTFIATVLPFLELGAGVKLVDCDPVSGQIDVSQVGKAITKRTRAIVPVHLYGYPAPVDALSKLCNSRRLLLEDAAQAHGSSVQGRKCGSFGHIAAFSFYPGKNLGAYGDGGAITTNDQKTAESVAILRNIGQKKKYDHVKKGFNSRLDTIQAAVLSVKLRHLDAWNKKRNRIADYFIRNLTGTGDLVMPSVSKNGIYTNYHLFTVQTAKRDRLMDYLGVHGIHCGIHYPVPLHLTPALSSLGYTKGDFPVSEKRSRELFSLPIYAELTGKQTEYIVKTIKKFFAR